MNTSCHHQGCIDGHRCVVTELGERHEAGVPGKDDQAVCSSD